MPSPLSFPRTLYFHTRHISIYHTYFREHTYISGKLLFLHLPFSFCIFSLDHFSLFSLFFSAYIHSTSFLLLKIERGVGKKTIQGKTLQNMLCCWATREKLREKKCNHTEGIFFVFKPFPFLPLCTVHIVLLVFLSRCSSFFLNTCLFDVVLF